MRVSENLDPEKSFQLAFESLKQIHSSELNSLFHARMKTRSASSIQLDLNSRFLVIALSLLQKSLQGCRKAKKAVVLDQLELVHTVIDIMVDKAYHEAVYLAASRVLGELDTTHMEHAPKIGRIAPWEWLEGADTDERSLMVSINARCMDQLAQVAISGINPHILHILDGLPNRNKHCFKPCRPFWPISTGCGIQTAGRLRCS